MFPVQTIPIFAMKSLPALFLLSVAAPFLFSALQAADKTDAPPPHPPAAEQKKPGFFKRLLGREEPAPATPAPVEATVPKKTATASARNQPKVAATKPAPAPPVEPAKPGFFKRLLGKSDKKSDSPAPEKPAVDAAVAKKTRTAAAAGKPVAAAADTKAQTEPEPEKKPGFFSRLFGPRAAEESANGDSAKPPRPADWESKQVITEDDAPIYAYGPAQPTGPDERLAKGTIVSMKQAGKSWSRITLEDGRSFMIGTVQMRKARESDFSEPEKAVAVGPLSPAEYFEPLPPPNLPEMTPGDAQPSGDLLIPLPPLPPP